MSSQALETMPADTAAVGAADAPAELPAEQPAEEGRPAEPPAAALQTVVLTDDERQLVDEPPSAASASGEGVVCAKCFMETDPEEAVAKGSNARWCRSCHRLSMCLSRNICSEPLALTDAEKTEFFRKAKDQTAGDGRLAYSKVRALLASSLRLRRVGGSYLPLEVWAVQGYNTDMIVAHGDKEWNTALGETWRAPIHPVSQSNVAQEIEEVVQKAERAVKRKKPESGGRKLAKKGRKKKKNTEKEEKKQRQKAEAKAKAKALKECKAADVAAAKAVAAFNPLLDKLRAAVGNLGPLDPAAAEAQAVQKHLDEVSAWQDAAAARVSKFTSGKAAPPTPFGAKDAPLKVKAANSALADFRKAKKEQAKLRAHD